jgi:HD-GYP domain-containing protein (c-di-GMP phosphodiesterase class II)
LASDYASSQQLPEETMDDGAICRLSEFAHSLSMALEERDCDTRLHSDRVVDIALDIGRRCGLSKDQLPLLRLGAAFHDIGKIGIPDSVLHKPGVLTEQEWQTMKSHSIVGENILLAIKTPGMDRVAAAVRCHHECFDGSGYPDGLAATEIPLLARIIAFADGYDASVTARPYHAGVSHHEAMALMRDEVGAKYDPALFRHFSASVMAMHGP